MKWKKIPGYDKWSLHHFGEHIGSVLFYEDKWRVWVKGEELFQEVSNPVLPKETTVKDAKAFALEAYLYIHKDNNSFALMHYRNQSEVSK